MFVLGGLSLRLICVLRCMAVVDVWWLCVSRGMCLS